MFRGGMILTAMSRLQAIATVEHSTDVEVEHIEPTDRNNESRQARRQRERLEKKGRIK